jgi:hypothetical protein
VPTQAAHGKKGCGALGSILLVVVAVAVATVVTAGAASVLTSQTFGAALGALTGGTALTGATAATWAAAGAIGGAVGSIASQGIGAATGLQDKFSWKGVGLAALAGGIGGGLQGLNVVEGASRGAMAINAGARGAISSAVTQGLAMATGLQTKFDWTGVAAAGVGSFASARFGPSGKGFGATLGRSMADGIAEAATRSVIDGTDFGDNILASLPSVVGNTIGNAVANGIAGRTGVTPAYGWADDGASTEFARGAEYLGRMQAGAGTIQQASYDQFITVTAHKASSSFWKILGNIGSGINRLLTGARSSGGSFITGISRAFASVGRAESLNSRAYLAAGQQIATTYRNLDQRYAVTTRLSGGLQTAGGIAEAAVGTAVTAAGIATSELGVGVPIAIGGAVISAHAADQIAAGSRTLLTGRPSLTITNRALQASGMSPTAAGYSDTALSIAFSAGGSLSIRTPLAATSSAGVLAAETAVPRTFTSSDPLVANLANEIEAAYPGHVVGVNVPVRNAAGQLVTDADIQLQNAIIQVKSGGGKGLTSQVLRTEQATGMPTIGYGPTLKPSVVRSINQAGGLVTTDKGLLIEVVKP